MALDFNTVVTPSIDLYCYEDLEEEVLTASLDYLMEQKAPVAEEKATEEVLSASLDFLMEQEAPPAKVVNEEVNEEVNQEVNEEVNEVVNESDNAQEMNYSSKDLPRLQAECDEIEREIARCYKALNSCKKRTGKLPPLDKKRVRNKHASCVSRWKKKLHVNKLTIELIRSRNMVYTLTKEAKKNTQTILALQRRNMQLKRLVGGY